MRRYCGYEDYAMDELLSYQRSHESFKNGIYRDKKRQFQLRGKFLSWFMDVTSKISQELHVKIHKSGGYLLSKVVTRDTFWMNYQTHDLSNFSTSDKIFSNL